MKYLYYPGCSLEGSSVEYHISTTAVLTELGLQIEDIKDWTCCGATAAESISYLLSFVLPARNLALAEKSEFSSQILVPCSACYLNLKKTEEKARKDKELLDKINQILAQEGLALGSTVQVRHLLDVLSTDVDVYKIKTRAENRMAGVTVAPYYGCQCLRPFGVFDDPEDPRSMDGLIEATGAEALRWDMGGQCCGASNATTKPETGLALAAKILRAAKGADAILTVCPMCQMNLETSQKRVSRKLGMHLEIPVLFLPQFLGLAMGQPPENIRLDLNLTNNRVFKEKVR